jgi:hypothetical protein
LPGGVEPLDAAETAATGFAKDGFEMDGEGVRVAGCAVRAGGAGGGWRGVRAAGGGRLMEGRRSAGMRHVGRVLRVMALGI